MTEYILFIMFMKAVPPPIPEEVISSSNRQEMLLDLIDHKKVLFYFESEQLCLKAHENFSSVKNTKKYEGIMISNCIKRTK